MRVETCSYGVDIVVDLPNGLYAYTNSSGSGKTRLFKLIQSKVDNGSLKATCITYNDLKNNPNKMHEIYTKSGELILLDRVDMYIDDTDLKALENASKNSVIIMDIKSDIDACYETVSLVNTQDYMEVSL